MPGRTDCTTLRAESPSHTALVFILTLIAIHLVADPRVRLAEWHVADSNHSLMEAKAWQSGHMDLGLAEQDLSIGHNRPRDTAFFNGRVYNVFPPLFTFLSYAALKLQQWQGLTGPDAGGFYAQWYVWLVALPLPLAAFWAFRQATGRDVWAAVLTAYLILGTPLLRMLENCQNGSQNELNHVLATTGLLLIAGDLLGKRRIWPAAIGLLIGMWTRQLTVLYLPAIAWCAWSASEHSARKLLTLGIVAAVGLGTLATLNFLKFESPFETGYTLIYEGRGDMYASRATRYGRAFDPRFIPTNAWYMNLSPPSVHEHGLGFRTTGHPDGTSIWMTTPLLLLALWDWKTWWSDRTKRALILCSLAVIVGLLCYHNTGSVQRGFYRFSLDFLPIWLAVIGVAAFKTERLQWLTFCALAYSALYFRLLA